MRIDLFVPFDLGRAIARNDSRNCRKAIKAAPHQVQERLQKLQEKEGQGVIPERLTASRCIECVSQLTYVPKCGEERPRCRNCSRRGSPCDLADDSAVPDAPARHPAVSPPAPTPDRLGGQTTNGGAGLGTLTVLDLELLHHYTTSTGPTLSSDPVTRHYYLVDVPKLGFCHPHVLYSILALAASHLGHFRPESRQYYYAEAAARHTAATSIAAPLLSNISVQDSVPMYCFSSLTLFISFANLKDDDHFFDASNVIPSWLTLFRGLRTILEANGRAMLSSSIAFLFRPNGHINDKGDPQQQQQQPDHEALREFQNHLEICTSEEEPTRQHLLAAFGDLRSAFSSFDAKEPGHEDKTRSIFTWLYKIPDGYIDLLRQKNSDALCILAFFCVLLHKLEYHWWLKGWGVHLIDRIYTAVDDAHHAWMRWPIQEIGWVPPRRGGRFQASIRSQHRLHELGDKRFDSVAAYEARVI
ncbi:hypothetical protein PG997_005552 [Apiospora hydei]|uniref:Zn(2)-C6 fungal-type domain-containing protein n=1 Tax=Apiospora hydei TaxID=1337664 RepID=A0ABR1WL73_9PEZI